MAALHRASTGYLLRHPWQLGLALCGIAIGVAVIVAVDLANSSARRAFEISVSTVTGAATHQIIGGPEGVDERLYVELRVRHGMRAVAPLVSGYASRGEETLQLLGVDLLAESGVRDFSAATAGSGSALPLRELLTTPGAALLSSGQAARSGVRIGDRFTVTVNGVAQRALLVGRLTMQQAGEAADNLLIVDVATAQAWLDRPGYLSRIDVVLPANADAEQALRDRLPAGVQLLPTERRSRSIVEMSNAFATNLTAMSLLALLVGVFLIYNSISFAVLQRRTLLGVLRALGVTRREVYALIVREALLLGVAGVLLGVLAGIWLGQHLLALVAQSINDLYFRVSVTDIAVAPGSVAKGVIAGLVATLVAASLPAVEAASVAPRLALSRAALEQRTRALLPVLTVGGLLLVAAAAVLLLASGASLAAGLGALFMLLLGVALWIPPLASACTRALAPLAQRLAGSGARLAISGIAASLSRTGIAIVALAVAVSATIGVSVMVDSFRNSVSAWIGQSLRADFYVAVADGGELQRDLLADLLAVPGIETHSSSRRVWLETEAGRTRLIALQMAPESAGGIDLLDADEERAWAQFTEQGAVLISETLAYRRSLAAGDSIQLTTARGPRPFRIAARYRSYDANAGAVLMNRQLYDSFWNDRGIDSLGIYLRDGADAQATLAGLRDVARGRQALVMRSNSDLRELTLKIFDRTFLITDVLYWLAIAVAIIGILGALLALQLERAREFAILRALGMTPVELGRLVLLQSGFIGALSGLAALPLGLLMAGVLIEVINRRAFGWSLPMDIDPQVLLTSFGLAVGASLAAGVYPALRAARRRPALAMREE